MQLSRQKYQSGAWSGMVFVIMAVLGQETPATERVITLKEHLNRQWTHELVAYRHEFAKEECAPDGVRLKGPEGEVAVQLSDVELWPGTQFVKTANVCFIVDELQRLATHSYTLTYSGKSVPRASGDLKVASRRGQVELTTSRFGVRLPLGEASYDTPRPPEKTLGPVQGMRLPDGTWIGGSRLYGKGLVKSWSSRVTDRGPVFARVETTYVYASGNTMRVAKQVAAGDYAMLADMDVKQDQPDDGWELLLSRGADAREVVTITGQRHYSKELTRKLDPKVADPVCYLCSWPGDVWFPDSPSALRVRFEGRKDELQVCVRDPGAWVKPQDRPPWSKFDRWTYETIPQMWSGWWNKRAPLYATADGAVLRMNLLAGQRRLSIGAETDGTRLLARYRGKTMSVYGPLPRLNAVKDMTLEWPDGKERHPYLFMSADEIRKRDPKALQDAANVSSLRGTLDKLGTIDLMRQVMATAARYDLAIDSGLLKPEERKLLKAQMAYLGYVTADPFHWSFERGCCSGNPNMTVSRVANLGLVGCVLRDHPMGKKWAMYAVDWAKYWLENVTDETGGWPESSHYARVSWSDFVQLAIVARQAGLHDFFKDPKFRAMARFYEKTLTPPDPLRRVGGSKRGTRVGAPYGRGTRGDAWGLGGLVARATAESDPAFSRVMQWSWRGCGYVQHFSHSTAGMSTLYADPSLPAAVPDWRSEYFPSLGYLLRSQVGTPQENYLLFVSEYYKCADGHLWPPHTGIIAKWFANGCPIGGAFRRIPSTSHVLLENRVLLACNWDPKVRVSPETGYYTKTSHDAFTSLPELDYVSVGFDIPEMRPHHLKIPGNAPAFPKRNRVGKPPFRWQRQLMLMKDDEPGGADYLVLRDTVQGGQPTQWHFWTLSEKIGTPEEAAAREAFLKDKPGAKFAPCRELKGDRFTAAGQFGKDLEYYVATPKKTPRYTLRYGTTGGAYGLRGFNEYQDLLHLQLPGDGSYFLAMFPRDQKAAAPTFSALADNTVIKVSGAFGTDYCLLSRESVVAKAEAASFKGMAAAVQERKSGLRLVLAAAGSVGYKELAVSAEIAVSMQAGAGQVALFFPEGTPGGEVVVRAPGEWKLAKARTGLRLAKRGEDYVLSIPPNARGVKLIKAH